MLVPPSLPTLCNHFNFACFFLDVFSSGRLLIIVSHFDAYYSAIEDGEVVAEDVARDIVRRRIKKKFNSDFPCESIAFMSCLWADYSKAFSTLNDREKKKLEKSLSVCEDKFEFEEQPSPELTLLKASRLEETEKK